MKKHIGGNIQHSDHLGSQVSSFLNSKDIITMLIEPGDSLWRFVSKKNSNKFSDYWIDSETMASIMHTFTSWNNYTQHAKKGAIQDNLAILGNWGSNLSRRVRITFKAPVIACKGQTGPQKFFNENEKSSIQMYFGGPAIKAIEHRIGGFQQYVIPRFKGINNAKAAEYAVVTYDQPI